MLKEEHYTIEPAKYAKNMMAVHIVGDGSGFRGSIDFLAAALAGERYSLRERSYIMSKRRAKVFDWMARNHWTANMTGSMIFHYDDPVGSVSVKEGIRQAELKMNEARKAAMHYDQDTVHVAKADWDEVLLAIANLVELAEQLLSNSSPPPKPGVLSRGCKVLRKHVGNRWRTLNEPNHALSKYQYGQVEGDC